MRLESLHLKNIRSYQEETLEFSTGITLLSGDIGAGKSTVLYAIEFALFGARRSDLSGDSLLRHGEKSGSVTLTFVLGDQRIQITRSLTQTSNGVRQDAGELIIGDSKQELTALELRAEVFSLLGYPQSLVSKSKDVMYRYTVYTPQEEMKRILTDSSSHRLDVLRSVFGIDSYKTVSENLSLVTKELRDEDKVLQGATQDVLELKDQAKTLRAKMGELSQQLRVVDTKKQSLQQDVKEKQSAVTQMQEEYEVFLQSQQKRALQKAQKQQLKQQLQEVQTEQKQLQSLLDKEIQPVQDPSTKREELTELSQKNLSAQASAKTQIRMLQEQIKQLQDDERSVTKLTKCPTCRQEVNASHKEHVTQHAQQEIDAKKEQMQTYQQRLEKASANLEKIASHKQKLSQLQAHFEAYKQQLRDQQQAKQQLKQLVDKQETLQQKLQDLSQQEVVVDEFNKEAFNKKKAVFEEANTQLQELRIQYTKLESQKQAATSRHEELKEQLKKRLAQQQRREVISSQEEWLSDVFGQAVSEIEKNVFASIHKEFSNAFTKHTHTLLEQADIFAVLDASFTPVITQDGYDVDISTLSGGERQSISLAYRLSLNETINRLVDSLQTNGLLILDEPTDGFSGEQLAKVRDVIRESDFSQLIIVSHEPRVQSFVDNVVFVRKNAQISEIDASTVSM